MEGDMIRVKRYWKLVALLAVVVVIGAACGGGKAPGGTTSSGTESPGGIPTGGILKMATAADVQSGWDPAKEYEVIAWEIYRCCLLRTLYSFSGDADTFPKPDLAADMPEVSVDGLTYTVKIKPGIHYAPPFADREITAEDFITAFGRVSSDEGSQGGYPFYFSVIKGFDDADGDPSKITGISAPDPHTLVFELTQLTADFPYRLTMAATAPVPAEAAEGHIKDYGRCSRHLTADVPRTHERPIGVLVGPDDCGLEGSGRSPRAEPPRVL